MNVLRLNDVHVGFSGRRGHAGVDALCDVTLDVAQGERVAIVGRSGAGKTTIARLAVGLQTPSAGSVEVLGTPLAGCSGRKRREVRRRVQLVFQDPYASLHPGMRVVDLVAEPLAIAGVARTERRRMAQTALEELGLHPAEQFAQRHPGTLSGGQRQRVAIARTLVAQPDLILADEPASMLDASLRATVATQILGVQEKLGATLVFITHDLALARHVADRIVVLCDGRVVEDGSTTQVLTRPVHQETRILLDAARVVRAGPSE